MSIEKAREIIVNAVDDGLIPGASWAVVYGNGRTIIDHYGYKCLIPEKIENSDDTLYDMASCTKVLSTTTIILQLIEKGYITLQTPLCEILSDFPEKSISIQHLLTHTSGICPDDKAYKAYRGKKEIWEFFRDKPLEFAPGTDLIYSDFGYIALGFVAEKFVGPIDEYAKRCIFEKLGMFDTMYCPAKQNLIERCASTEATVDRGIIVGQVHDGKAWRLDGVSGNAGLFSTTHDISQFISMMISQGELVGKRILSSNTIDLLKRCYTVGLRNRRTLGWICNDPTAAMGDYYSQHCLFHTGFTGTSIYIDFDKKCGIALLTNRIHPNRNNESIKEIRNKFHNQVLFDFDKDQ